MTLVLALHALRLLRVVELAWKAVLARIFNQVDTLAGNAWAWRVVKFVYALPFVGGSYLAGVICVWDAQLSPHIGGAVCAGIMAAFVCGSWLSEWWRG